MEHCDVYTAEARVRGVLRGGTYFKQMNLFVFHSGTTEIRIKDFTDLLILKKITTIFSTPFKE